MESEFADEKRPTKIKDAILELILRLEKYAKLREAGEAPLNPVIYELGQCRTNAVLAEEERFPGTMDVSLSKLDPGNIYCEIQPPETAETWKNAKQVAVVPILEKDGRKKGKYVKWKVDMDFPWERTPHGADGSPEDLNVARAEGIFGAGLVYGGRIRNIVSGEPLVSGSGHVISFDFSGYPFQARNLERLAIVIARCSNFRIRMVA